MKIRVTYTVEVDDYLLEAAKHLAENKGGVGHGPLRSRLKRMFQECGDIVVLHEIHRVHQEIRASASKQQKEGGI